MMLTFSIAAALLSALVAALILQRASGAARNTDADPTLAVYRRQLSEIEDLADRGLLGEAELKAARAEAARRLLGAAKTVERPSAEVGSSQTPRALFLAILGGAVAAPVLAGALYFVLGKPGLSDQPYAARLKVWTANPAQFGPGEMAAVLKTVAKDRPNDAEPLTYLAQVQVQAGNVPGAAESIRKAIRLEPKDADLWANLGILLLMQGQGEETAPSGDAFREALKLDPKNAAALYHLARARIAAGDVAGGLDQWRVLAAELPAADPQRPQLQAQIDATAKAGRLIAMPQPPSQQQQAGGGGSAEALAGALTGQDGAGPPSAQASGAPDPRQMVAQLEQRLQQDPNNLAGWQRLIRSYAVLGMPDKLKQAQVKARQIFKGQPEALQAIDNATAAPQGSE